MLTADLAIDVVRAALRAGKQQPLHLSIVVVDASGHVVAGARDDAAGFLNFDIARRKAATAANFGVATEKLLALVKDDPLLLAAMNAEPSLMMLAGGAPIYRDGTLLGAVGIAGGHHTQAQAIAESALASVMS